MKNRPGASGMVAANWLYNIAKRDGLTLGAIHRTPAADPGVGGPPGALRSGQVQLGRHAGAGDRDVLRAGGQRYKTVEDLMNAAKPVKMSATQPRSDIFIVPLMLNNVVGTKLEVTSGYRGLGAAALGRGEGRGVRMCGWGYASLRALRARLVRQQVHPYPGAGRP